MSRTSKPLDAVLPSSFRDPAGYVFRENNVVKRVVTRYGKQDYQLYLSSGLRECLVSRKLVVDHDTEEVPDSERGGIHAILAPRQIPFISYPYEWCFDQLKDASLLTLSVQEEALTHGMSLKDASAFNVQFVGAAPIFIDLCSFQTDDGGPWLAYEQFCRHFLGPLLLMSHCDPAANRFLRTDLDGMSVEFVSRLLPFRTWLRPDTLLNIHWHARCRTGFDDNRTAAQTPSPSRGLKKNIVASLRAAVGSVRTPRATSVWSSYAANRTHYPDPALSLKQELVRQAIRTEKPGRIFDLGANTGSYSAEAIRDGGYCVAFDADPGCVNECYRRVKSLGCESVLPLVMNLANPSPSAGFNLTERCSLIQRGPADLALTLALIHHLRLSARVPFTRIAAFLAGLAKSILIEFVPLADPMAQRLLRGRTGDMGDYTLTGFLSAFEGHFTMSHCADLPGTSRSIWLGRPRTAAGL